MAFLTLHADMRFRPISLAHFPSSGSVPVRQAVRIEGMHIVLLRLFNWIGILPVCFRTVKPQDLINGNSFLCRESDRGALSFQRFQTNIFQGILSIGSNDPEPALPDHQK